MAMNSYLFPDCIKDPVTRGLTVFRENRDLRGYFTAFAALLEFSRREGVTRRTIREYGVRLILERPGVGGLFRLASLSPYLEKDIAALYDLCFAFNWDACCAEYGVLPLPAGSCAVLGDDYRYLMTRLTGASSAGELQTLLSAFFEDNADSLEAMYPAQRWDGERLAGILRPDPVTFEQLGGLAYQKRMLIQNLRAFLDGGPASDVLLVGGGGTGKSSCVKAALNHFADEGLRLVELDKRDIDTLPRLLRTLWEKRRHYIVFIDDLTFDTPDVSYMGLKVALDGQVEARPPHVLVFATSNRRGLVRDSGADETLRRDEAGGEELSLAQRFGLHLYFSNLTQAEYTTVLELLLTRYGIPFSEELAHSALAWSETNGGRSGRSAKQFVGRYLAR